MSDWAGDKSEFTPLAGGRVTYDGEKAIKCQCEVEITLNGENIKPGETFVMKHDDVVVICAKDNNADITLGTTNVKVIG